MLKAPAPYPHVGSYALFADPMIRSDQRRAELVRILRLSGTMAFIAFPLRTGAAGNSCVPLDDLLDGTPLDQADQRELADLSRTLAGRSGRTPKQRTQLARVTTLRDRAMWSILLEAELAKMRLAEARTAHRTGGSLGSLAPREAGA